MPAVNLLTATAGDMQRSLSSGILTSVELVNACLDQIEQHDDYLHAVISKPPRMILVEQAEKLDVERKMNGARGKLHGIPILIKVLPSSFSMAALSDRSLQDNIATLPEFHMDTTAGSLALVGSKPKSNADIIERVSHLLCFPGHQDVDLNPARGSGSDHYREGKSIGTMSTVHTQSI